MMNWEWSTFYENIILRRDVLDEQNRGDTFKKKKRSEKNVLIPQSRGQYLRGVFVSAATDWVLFNILQSHKPYGFPDGFSIDANILFVEAIFIWTNTTLSNQHRINILPWKQWGKEQCSGYKTTQDNADASHSSGPRIHRATIRADNKRIPANTFARIFIVTTYFSLNGDAAGSTQVSPTKNNANDSSNSAVRWIYPTRNRLITNTFYQA